MDLHTYTRELLDKHLLPELKEIAQGLGIIPDGNKTRRETWVAALVGKPFPIFQSIGKSLDVDRAQEPIENSPGADRAQEPIEPVEKSLNVGDSVKSRTQRWGIENKSLDGTVVALLPRGGVRVCFGAGGIFEYSRSLQLKDLIPIDRAQEPIENSPAVIQAQEPIENSPAVIQAQEPIENSPGVIQAQEPAEFPDLESALAEIARLRTQNRELLDLARSQSARILRAKDISPVERPSFKRVSALAQEAFLTVSKSAEGGWTLSMAHLKRGFSKLHQIWDLLVSGDWYLEDLFSPPPPLPAVPKPLFAPVHSRYSAIPFCDDSLIDIWSLGVNVASSGRSPPAGGDAM